MHIRHHILGFLFLSSFFTAMVVSRTTLSAQRMALVDDPILVFRERIYVSTDKPAYLSGESLWLSVFCFEATTHSSSNLSSVAYLELQDQQKSVIQIKAALKEGRGSAMILLPPSLPTGNYRLTAYTRYMQNESPEVFFYKIISIYNTLSSERVSEEEALQPSDTGLVPDSSTDILPIRIRPTSNNDAYRSHSAIPLVVSNQSKQSISYSVSVYGVDSLDHYHNPPIDEYLKTTDASGVFHHLFVADYEGEIIRGKIVNSATGIPAYPGDETKVYLSVVGPHLEVYNGKIDADGNLAFFTSSVYGDREVVTDIYPSQSQTFRIVLDDAFASPEPVPLPGLVPNKLMETSLLRRSLGAQIEYRFQSHALHIPMIPVIRSISRKKIYKLDEYTRFPTMREVITEFVSEARFRSTGGQTGLHILLPDAMGQSLTQSPEKSLVLLDGIPIFDHEKILEYNPLLIDRLTLYDGVFRFGSVTFPGIADFKSYTGRYPGITFGAHVRIHQFSGVQYPISFSAPFYPTQNHSVRPDWRHTLYWNPNILSQAGEEKIITCYSSDYTGDFIAVIEGVTADGQGFRKTCRFSVIP